MKCYNHSIPIVPHPVDEDTIEQPAKMLGSSISDGRYNGVCDGSAGLLQRQYDNDSSMAVDPLCDFGTDVFSLRGPSPTPSSTADPSPAE